MRDRLGRRNWWLAASIVGWLASIQAPTPSKGAEPRAAAAAGVTREGVEQSIKIGVNYLLKAQRDNGTWGREAGESALVALALLTAGESPDSEPMRRALQFLRRVNPNANAGHATYTVSLVTMVLAAADPEKYRDEIARYAEWLELAQTGSGLLGLNAASEVGVKVKDEVWKLAREYWQRYQQRDGAWGYTPDAANGSTASMTCAGISSLVISGLKRFRGAERLVGNHGVEDCGKGSADPNLEAGIRWIATHFNVGQNFGANQQWKYYYLYGLERVGRLSGVRFLGDHDWYREGAEELVHDQDRLEGFWRGQQYERYPTISTSFALLFLAKGRAPVVVNKLRHGSGTDWNNDADDVRNLVGVVSRDWSHLLTWQVVDPDHSRVEDLLQAPIAFFNGHDAPELSERGERNLRDFVDQGGFIFAEACCGRPEFDRGFRALMKRVFPDQDYELHPLASDHAVWRSRWPLNPQDHPLWGIEHGCRTVVIYSPDDLSCDWNQIETQADLPRVTRSTRIGQNVVDYATGRELPADKLSTPEVKDFRAGPPPRRNALRIGKLRHAGDWNIAPLAIPNLTTTLRDKLKIDVVINHKELFPRDPNLIHYPLIYVHGRAALSFDAEDLTALRRHLDPGGGVLFADAACGSPAFDVAFRKFVAQLLPGNPMIPIPRDDDLYTNKVHFDLKDVQYTKPAGGGKDFPQLEGVKVNGRWAVIYSKYDIGCALEKHQGLDCKGYTYESAMRIASNIVIYATLP